MDYGIELEDEEEIEDHFGDFYCELMEEPLEVVEKLEVSHGKRVQNKIREQDGILLLLQQCVADEDNPFLREWGIWAVRNILEGNIENQQVIANLELQGSVDVPEIAQLGLRVQVDPETRRAKLVNV